MGGAEDMGHHSLPSLGESEIEDEAEREQPDRRREPRRERAGHGGGDRQGRRGEQGGDEGEPSRAGGGRAARARARHWAERESPPTRASAKSKASGRAPAPSGTPRPAKRRSAKPVTAASGRRDGGPASERHGGQREDGGGRVGNVTDHEPGQARDGRNILAGHPDASRPGLVQRDEGGDELWRREQETREDERRSGQRKPPPRPVPRPRTRRAARGRGARRGAARPRRLPPATRRGEAGRPRPRGRRRSWPGHARAGIPPRGAAAAPRGPAPGPSRCRRGRGDEGGAPGEAECGHEGADAISSQAPRVEERERAQQRQRREDEPLEGLERGERSERHGEGVEALRGGTKRATASPENTDAFQEGISPRPHARQTSARSGRWSAAPSPGARRRPLSHAGA